MHSRLNFCRENVVGTFFPGFFSCGSLKNHKNYNKFRTSKYFMPPSCDLSSGELILLLNKDVQEFLLLPGSSRMEIEQLELNPGLVGKG